ncbi:MAG: alkaline phosphatase, partial [Acetobacteraceae bacterium]
MAPAPSGPSRRGFLKSAGLLAAPFLAPPFGRVALAAPVFAAYPFKLGVASGDPVAGGFVIWTRLAPDPLNGGGLPPDAAYEVRWEVASDARFLHIRRRGIAIARPERGHSVHVDVDGLEPDRWYFYRFVAGNEASPIGRSRTFPVVGTPKERFRFAFVSCQHFAQGYFNAYEAMLDDDLDVVLHLGDYIYENDSGSKVRWHLEEPTTLAGYRNHHALYKSDPSLQAAHAAYPFLATWDDHDVQNDYAGLNTEDRTPTEIFRARRAAAYQAYYEHMPLRRAASPNGPDMRLFTASVFGDLVHLVTLDTRQYRSSHACRGPNRFGGQLITGCEERLDPSRTMLGRAQEQWVARQLSGARAAWKLVGQSLMMAELRQGPAGDSFWSDGWDGYPAARDRLLGVIAQRRISDVVVLSGDIHSFWANDLKTDFRDIAAPPVATEFVTTSITTDAASNDVFQAVLPMNPHVHFAETRYRGYSRAEVVPGRLGVDFRAMR